MSESRFTIRLCDEITNELQLINYLHSIPKSRRAEHIRLLLNAGYNAVVNHTNTPSPAVPPSIPTQVVHPVAPLNPVAPSHRDVTPLKKAAPSQQDDTINNKSSQINDEHSEDESESDGMDASDPLAKMKNKFR